jgi:hypothetical protein
MTGYSLKTWANGFGVWHCKITFDGAGAGNAPAGQRLTDNGRRAAQRAIRREILLREAPRKIRRLRYAVVANQEASTGQLLSLTIAEDTK